jgi:hypothetical protein
MDDDDSLKDKDNDDIDNNDGNASFKAFHLLNALSDLLMLPKDMLLSASIRKEVGKRTCVFLHPVFKFCKCLLNHGKMILVCEGLPNVWCINNQEDSRKFCSGRVLP